MEFSSGKIYLAVLERTVWLHNQSITIMRIKGINGWWLEDTSFVFDRNKATNIETMDECKEVVKKLLEIPWLEPEQIVIEDRLERIRGDRLFKKVSRYQLLRELKKIDLGGKCKNLAHAKELLDNGHSICVNGCEIWNDGSYYHWLHYGSSAHRRTLQELRFIFSKIADSDDFSFSVIPSDLGNWEIRNVA